MSATATATTQIPAGTWNVDPIHSTIEFQVRNMGIVTIKGYFEDFEGSFESDGEGVHVRGAARAASVNTRSEKRDQHLRAADFFDVASYPEILFESSRIEQTDDAFAVVGDLTIKGITREVAFRATVEGFTPDPWGGERLGIEAVAEVDRRDFGLNWDVKTPTGIPLASYDVKILIHLGAVKAS
jgi:polyisoprenoid-binding protein YceI